MWEPSPSISRDRATGAVGAASPHSVLGHRSAAAPEPFVGINPTSGAEQAYKTDSGTYWHLAATPFTSASAYVHTVCGRRLGRWNLMPSVPTDHIEGGALCSGCRRKAGLR